MKSQEEILRDFFEYAKQIGMNIYFDSDSDPFKGFIIGTDEYLNDISEGIEDVANYDRVTNIEYKAGKEDLH